MISCNKYIFQFCKFGNRYSSQATKDLAIALSFFLKDDGECFLANHVIRVNKLETQFEKDCADKGLEVKFQGFLDDEQKIKLHKITKIPK